MGRQPIQTTIRGNLTLVVKKGKKNQRDHHYIHVFCGSTYPDAPKDVICPFGSFLALV